MARALWLFAVGSLIFTGARPVRAQTEPVVPAALQPWREWVLNDVPEHACAHRGDLALCVWPGRLSLDLDAQGGRFAQKVSADRELFFALPGTAGRWPLDVTVDGKAAAVV